MDWRKNERSAHRGSDCGGGAGTLAGLADFAGAEEKRGAGKPAERAAARLANDWDGTGAKYGADGHDWPECIAAAGERDQGAAGRRFQLRADCHSGTNGDRQRTQKYAGTDRPHPETAWRIPGAGTRDFVRDKIARRNSWRGEDSRAAWGSDPGAFAGRLVAALAVRDAVPFLERRVS